MVDFISIYFIFAHLQTCKIQFSMNANIKLNNFEILGNNAENNVELLVDPLFVVSETRM